MAISEACKYEIEEDVDKACEKKGVSKKEAFEALETFYNKIGVEITFSAVKGKYYRAKSEKKEVTNVTPDKPPRKHTKPDIKNALKNTAEAIAKGEVSDDDIKQVDFAIAKAIKTGKAARRVGVSTANAVRTNRKVKGGFTEAKPIDNFYRLNRHMKACIDGMTAWADGQIEPTSKDEALEARAILAKAASFMLQFARLGIDMEGIYDTFVKGDYKNAKKKRDKIGFDPG